MRSRRPPRVSRPELRAWSWLRDRSGVGATLDFGFSQKNIGRPRRGWRARGQVPGLAAFGTVGSLRARRQRAVLASRHSAVTRRVGQPRLNAVVERLWPAVAWSRSIEPGALKRGKVPLDRRSRDNHALADGPGGRVRECRLDGKACARAMFSSPRTRSWSGTPLDATMSKTGRARPDTEALLRQAQGATCAARKDKQSPAIKCYSDERT